MNFDKIGSSKAVDKTASLVTSKGEHFVGSNKVLTMDSELPITTKPVPRKIENIIGMKKSRLTVIGFFDRRKGKTNRWVVKCTCGMYSVRKGQSLRAKKDNFDACEKCRHTEYLRRSSEYQSYGKNTI